jgi:hypothetical protein
MIYYNDILKKLRANAGKLHLPLIVALFTLTFNSCGLIRGVFEAGVGIGIFLVIAVIVIIAIIASRLRRRR